MTESVSKFDARADEYAVQSRIALAGYDACHELTACLLAARLGRDTNAHVLVAGAGGIGQEILVAAGLAPCWRFTAADPSGPMLDGARAGVAAAGLGDRVDWRQGTVQDLPTSERYDAATLIGVLHHLPGQDAKLAVLAAVAARLRPGAPFVLACNRGAYADKPAFLAAWSERWRMHGASEAEVAAKLGRIVHAADPPASDDTIVQLLGEAGFGDVQPFFSSLFWGAWITTRMHDR